MTDVPPHPSSASAPQTALPPDPALMPLVLRAAVGGALMGLANLVPGISGGTMLLAAGIYPRFVKAIGEVTTFCFRRASLITLGVVAIAAVVVIAGLARPVSDLVVHQRWVMYSLFIGLTLGGVPILLRLIGHVTTAVLVAAAAGLVTMAALALYQATGDPTSGTATEGDPTAFSPLSFLFYLAAGIAAASAMVLPGVSGSYLLLVLGVYVPILRAVDAFLDGVLAFEIGSVLQIGVAVVLPVGLGVIAGIAGVSNLLRYLLEKHEKPTLGVLLGLLIGAVAGLWPFQEGVAPAEGSVFMGRVITAERLAAMDPAEYPTAFFTPTAGQAAAALGLIAAGFLVTWLIDYFGREKA